MSHGHISKADDQPYKNGKAAELEEGPEILHGIQAFAKGMDTLANSVAEFWRDQSENPLKNLGCSRRIHAYTESKQRGQRHPYKQAHGKKLKDGERGKRMAEEISDRRVGKAG